MENNALLDQAATDAGVIEQIVVGVDHSPPSEDAVAHAITVARRTGARVALVHVGVVPEVPLVPPSMAITAHAYREVLLRRLDADRQWLEELRQRCAGQGVELSHAVIDGVPDTGVAAAGRGMVANLLVVGSHGRTGVRRALLGSVAERTVRVANCSVLVARGPARAGGYRRIVVGTDLSPGSDLAFARVLSIAAAGAEVLVVHCRDPLAVAIDVDPDADAVIRRLRTRIASAGLDPGGATALRFEVVDAPPSVGLAAVADREGADLLVVGSHGRRGLPRVLLGSVAEASVRHAHCSVLVAR